MCGGGRTSWEGWLCWRCCLFSGGFVSGRDEGGARRRWRWCQGVCGVSALLLKGGGHVLLKVRVK